jgi:hypothetical protein
MDIRRLTTGRDQSLVSRKAKSTYLRARHPGKEIRAFARKRRSL